MRPRPFSGARPRLGVSGRLLDPSARCHGEHCRSHLLSDALNRHVDWLPLSPEAEADPGEEFGPEELDGYVLHEDSPRGAALPTPGGDGGGEEDPSARRPTAPPPVEEQCRLAEPGPRELFLRRVFARARLRVLWESPWRPRDLVSLHTGHKLQLMSHSPEGYRETGRIVARAGSAAPGALRDAYTLAFHRAMAVRPTRGKHVNALQHALGMLGPRVADAHRRELLEAIEDYRLGRAPLDVPVALLRHQCAADGTAWTCGQTYLRPYPDDLRARRSLAAASPPPTDG